MSPATSGRIVTRAVSIVRSVKAEHRHEGLLRDLDVADALHPRLAGLLLLKQLALAGDVAAVALGDVVLPRGGDRLSGTLHAPTVLLNDSLAHMSRDLRLRFTI